MSPDIKGIFIKYAAMLVGFFVTFVLVGSRLSHYLFLWFDVAASPGQSSTNLWALYIAAIAIAAIILFFVSHPLEGFVIGVLASLAAGGFFVIGYTNPLIPLAVAVLVAGVVFLAFRQGPLRAGYIGVCVGLFVPLCIFAYNATSLTSVAGLSYSSSASDKVDAFEWAEMSSSQRESYLAGVIQTEASRLNTGSVKATQVILPKEVIATISADGSVMVNYAAVRVASPDNSKVLKFEEEYETEWIYERLTSPTDVTLAVVHSMAHIYQTQRVAGQVKEQRTWPYEDADELDGTNDMLDEWAEEMPIDPFTDIARYDTTLEDQAWGYASNRLSSYVE